MCFTSKTYLLYPRKYFKFITDWENYKAHTEVTVSVPGLWPKKTLALGEQDVSGCFAPGKWLHIFQVCLPFYNLIGDRLSPFSLTFLSQKHFYGCKCPYCYPGSVLRVFWLFPLESKAPLYLCVSSYFVFQLSPVCRSLLFYGSSLNLS